VQAHPIGTRARGLLALARNRLRRDPLNVTLELTRRCNAKCDYCNHWKEQKQTELDLAGFVRVVERFQPFSVTVCGGEPFLRKDAIDIIAAVKRVPGWRWVSIITNGWFLTDEKIDRLLATGIDQINVSLNFPDERQDADRKLPGLYRRIARAVPAMVARGGNVQLNTILMNENLDDAVAIAEQARGWGATVMYTLYSELPADNHAHLFPPERRARLDEVLRALVAEKRAHRTVANTEWYFENIPSYVGGRVIDGCTAGKETLHVSPGGMVRPCAELPFVGHFEDYDPRAAAPVDCTRCFQACRGEVQAPITTRRLVDALRGYA
jgi:MoaA/NifB/PqqE/SkfB family radical SAM enzyme